MTSNKTKPPDIEPRLTLVGKISAEWARLETGFDITIMDLVGGDSERLHCVTAQFTSYHSKLLAIESLLHHHNAPENTRKQLRRFKGALGEIAQQRNRVIHDPWIWPGEGDVEQLRPRSKKKDGDSTVEEFERLLSSIKSQIERFRKVRDQILKNVELPDS